MPTYRVILEVVYREEYEVEAPCQSIAATNVRNGYGEMIMESGRDRRVEDVYLAPRLYDAGDGRRVSVPE